MTARGRARILIIVSFALLLASGGSAYLSASRVARLRALQTTTQIAFVDALRLATESSHLLHSSGTILPVFEDWKTLVVRTADNLEALVAHPGLAMLKPELSERAAQALRAWKAMRDTLFIPAQKNLEEVFAEMGYELGGQGITSGRLLTASGHPRLQKYYLPMAQAERQLSAGTDFIAPFVTTNLDELRQEIAKQSDSALRQTIQISAAAIVVLIAFTVGSLLYSIRFLDQANRDLEAAVRQRTRAIQSLLDFSGRGFLSFGPDLIVRPEHSRDCELILGEGIAGKRLPDLLYADGTARAEFVRAMDLIFSGKSRPEVIFDLIDREVQIGDRVVELDFRVIDAETLMCSLQDITERKRLESQIMEQQELSEMVVRVAMNRRAFVSLTREAEDVFRELHAYVHSDADNPDRTQDAEALLRSLHTFKANAAFLRMKRTADQAHALEQSIQDSLLVDNPDDHRAGLEAMIAAYRAELDVVREHLGDEWIREPDTVTVRRRPLLEAERLARTAHPDDHALQAALEAARMIPIGELLERYNDTVQILASSRAKRVKPLEIAGGDALVLPEQFERISGCIVHLLRNMVDHGIERPNERSAAGKHPEGHIRIAAKATETGLELTLSDDGRGIPLEAVEAKARLLGLLAPGAKPTERDLLRLIFRPGFSTSETVTVLSGRGVGLAAVLDTVSKLGGRVSLSTRKGQGTTFTIWIPRQTGATG